MDIDPKHASRSDAAPSHSDAAPSDTAAAPVTEPEKE